MPGGSAGSRHADGRLLDEASDRVRRAVCSFMIPPALIVDDWPVFRIVGQTLDFQLSCSIYRARRSIARAHRRSSLILNNRRNSKREFQGDFRAVRAVRTGLAGLTPVRPARYRAAFVISRRGPPARAVDYGCVQGRPWVRVALTPL